MRLRDIFEDVESDVDASEQAESARRLLIQKLQNEPRIRWNPKKGEGIRTSLESMNQDTGETFHTDIWFAQGPRNTGTFMKVAGVVRSEGRLILRIGNIPLTKENIIDFLQSKNGASTFRHEYIHFIDLMQRQKDRDHGEPMSGAEAEALRKARTHKEYFNDDAEFNAYFHEAAEPLLAILRTARDEGIEAAQQLEKIEPDFKRFLRVQHFFSSERQWAARSHFNEHFKQRYIKRLYVLHSAVKAIQGTTAPYDPTIKQRIFRWLVDQLSKLPGVKHVAD